MQETISENRTGRALAVVIVTFNRCRDLAITLDALASMQSVFNYLLVVNNASTDETPRVLNEFTQRFNGKLIIRNTELNLGGAGGFHTGLKSAIDLPVDWIWMSDDDAVPQPGCLSNILDAADSTDNVYGSVAITMSSADRTLCWPAPAIDRGKNPASFINTWSELEPRQEVSMIPFLGFMVSKKKVLEVGLPEKAYFISGDDAEYCIRMRASGSKIIQIRSSIVIHPEIPRYTVRIGPRHFHCLTLPPWRRYFDVRNRMWNARKMDGARGGFASLATHIMRFVFTLLFEKETAGQLGAYLRGIRDGLSNMPDNL